jgi:hypothetical protein
MRKTEVINGINFPYETKEQGYTNPYIQGKVWALSSHLPKDIREITHQEWTEKGHHSVRDLYYARNTEKPTTLNKTMWSVLFNKPGAIVIHTGMMDTAIRAWVSHCAFNGIPVRLIDEKSGTNMVIEPVCNLAQSNLFRKFLVESIDVSTLDSISQSIAYDKRQLLATLRKQYKAPYWVKLNEIMSPVDEFYKWDKVESYYEKSSLAQRYAINDTLRAYELNLSVFDLDKNPMLLEMMVLELSIWADCFDMSLKLSKSEVSVETHTPIEWLIFGADAWSKTNFKMTEQGKYKGKIRRLQALEMDPTAEIIKAYMQVRYYRENNLVEEFLSARYILCPVCGNPILLSSDSCRYCSHPQEAIEEVNSDWLLFSN